MKKMLPAAAALVLLAGTACAAEGQWGYAGENGPEHWAALDPSFALCAQRANQSPVNLTGFIEAELEPISFDYSGLVTKLRRTNSTVQADYSAGSFITLGGRSYELKQIDFHTPSEHQIDGESFPLEAQFVHADANGQLAVISVLYNLGEENFALKKLWQQMPTEAGQEVGMATQVRADKLLPENREYYRVTGSLTTPPCTEGVLWLILKNQVATSEAQVKQFSELLGGPNNRPPQSLKARAVLQ
ncbi:MAG: carbonic anhydrase [Candidatus Electronema aureum]|uniref:carbonic anhydrase n=1 Tax=Candidatus Electronema aureum TaxID=2005002 RepID=A0A521FZ84_9BACT|nr:MAG: carbonic anhydrase [Candidatus Electronema aureum]